MVKERGTPSPVPGFPKGGQSPPLLDHAALLLFAKTKEAFEKASIRLFPGRIAARSFRTRKAAGGALRLWHGSALRCNWCRLFPSPPRRRELRHRLPGIEPGMPDERFRVQLLLANKLGHRSLILGAFGGSGVVDVPVHRQAQGYASIPATQGMRNCFSPRVRSVRLSA